MPIKLLFIKQILYVLAKGRCYTHVHFTINYRMIQFSSVTRSCPTLCNPMNGSMPGPPVHHQVPEFTQTHVHQVGDAIQASHPLSSPSPPVPNPPTASEPFSVSQLFA